MTDDKINDMQEYTEPQTEPQQEYVEEARRHAQHISENYKKLLDKATTGRFEEPVAEYGTAYPETEQLPADAEYAPSAAYGPMETETVIETYPAADNAARISGYTAHPAPASKKALFEGVTYTKGSYMHGPGAAVYTAPAPETGYMAADTVAEAPAEVMAPETVTAPETVMAPSAQSSADDSIPTPRTMLHRTLGEAAEVPAARTGFWAALSTKMRVALAAVTSAIVVAVMLVCMNTAILGSLDADIASKQMRLTQLRQTSEELQDRIDEVRDPGYVDQWAQENGLVR